MNKIIETTKNGFKIWGQGSFGCTCNSDALRGCYICKPQSWEKIIVNEGSNYKFDTWQYKGPPEHKIKKGFLPEDLFEI